VTARLFERPPPNDQGFDNGDARLVLVIGPWALKFARGARGCRPNKYEANLFQTASERRRVMLCAVRWCSGGGWLLVMATVRPLSKADHEDLLDRRDFPDWDYRPGEDDAPFEYKASDWGRMRDGRLVTLDYSTPAHLTQEEFEKLMHAATWPD
jgi:hypothetical protein